MPPRRLLLLSLIALLASAHAQPAPRDAPAADPAMALRAAALDNLLAERESMKAFDAALSEARKHGVNEQAILEARFLYHVDHGEDAAIAALLPEFLKRRDSFRVEDSAVFGFKEDWLAVIEYVQAIAVLGKGDKDAFKKHITEAFWLSPRQAAAFAPHIERMRLEEAMRAVKLDFNTGFVPVQGGDAVTPAKLIEGKKALLLHFWSPWSRECEASMQDFVKTSTMLSSLGFAIVSLVPGDSPKVADDARPMIRPLEGKACGSWLVDSSEKPFARDLRIQNLPAMVLVSTAGSVLFNGDPIDDEFWEALRKIDPAIQRPESGRRDAE